MKTKTISTETKNAISTYLMLNEKFRNSFFWSPPSGASSRRSYEEKNSFEYSGDGIELTFKVECSCKNIYITKSVSIDGMTTNATSLKKFINN